MNDTLSLTINSKSINLDFETFYECLEDYIISPKYITCNNGLVVKLNVPHDLFLTDNMENIIPSIIEEISLENDVIKFQEQNLNDKNQILANIPPINNNDLKDYIKEINKDIVLYSGNTKNEIGPIIVNLISSNVMDFIRMIFESYSFDGLRHILYHLSKKIDNNIILNSTPFEMDFYLNLYQEELKQKESSGNLNI